MSWNCSTCEHNPWCCYLFPFQRFGLSWSLCKISHHDWVPQHAKCWHGITPTEHHKAPLYTSNSHGINTQKIQIEIPAAQCTNKWARSGRVFPIELYLIQKIWFSKTFSGWWPKWDDTPSFTKPLSAHVSIKRCRKNGNKWATIQTASYVSSSLYFQSMTCACDAA